MIDHLTIPVADFDAAKKFYTAALGPLGYRIQHEENRKDGRWIAMGPSPEEWRFEIFAGEKIRPAIHFAFGAKSEAEVRAFYDAALANGGTDNGPPGPRPDYGPKYFAAFAFDPDGNNIEAVWNPA